MDYLKEAKKHNPNDWYVEHTAALPFSVSGLGRGFTGGTKIRPYGIILAYFQKDQMDWITLLEDQNKIGALIVGKGYAFWRQEFKSWIKIKKSIEKSFRALRKKDISKMSNSDVVREVENWVELNWEERKTSSLMDPFMFYAERKLTELLKDFIKRNPKAKININEAQEILTRPEAPSFFSEFEGDLIKIAKEKNGAKVQKMLADHLKKFA